MILPSFIFRHVLLCFLLLGNTIAGSLPKFLRASTPTPPGQDAFYTPPAGFENALPGTILKSRPVPEPLTIIDITNANLSAAYQLLFRTQDAHQNPQAAVTTIMVPYNADPSKTLSYLYAYDSSDINCTTSYSLQNPDLINGSPEPQLEMLLMQTALDRGWIVNAPDYNGLQAAFTSGWTSGYVTLDSLRAVLSSGNITGVKSDATSTLWGYSGGSIAGGFAAQLHPVYAPELEIAGIAIGGTTPNIYNVAQAVNKGPFVGLVPDAIWGLAHDYPELIPVIESKIKPSMMAQFDMAQHVCFVDLLVMYFGQDIYSYVNDTNVFNEPTPLTVLNEQRLGNMTPSAPVLLYKSVGDEVSPINDTDLLVDDWCTGGANVEYVRDELSEHGVLFFTGPTIALPWLDDRMAGTPAQQGCSNTTTISTILSPEGILALGETIVDDMRTLLGDAVGPNDTIDGQRAGMNLFFGNKTLANGKQPGGGAGSLFSRKKA